MAIMATTEIIIMETIMVMQILIRGNIIGAMEIENKSLQIASCDEIG